MKKDRSSLGICTSAECIQLDQGPVERYAGAGQYCPNCGELLQLYDPQKPPRWQAAERSALPVVKPEPTQPIRLGKPALIGALILALGVGGVLTAPHLSASAPSSAASMFGVCGSSVTNRLAHDIVGAFVAQHQAYANRIEVRDTNCAVRFSTALDTGHPAAGLRTDAAGSGRRVAAAFGSTLGHDGLVAIVNPQNPVNRLTLPQLRDVFAGRIGDWSQLGGPRGPIVAVVPPSGSDEAQAVASNVMGGQPFGAQVRRDIKTDGIARSVSSPSGAHWIGVVPFSAALPAKVIALGTAPPPSPISIANGQYPIVVRILAESDFRHPSAPAAGLIAFARSSEANGIIARDALVSKDNP